MPEGTTVTETKAPSVESSLETRDPRILSVEEQLGAASAAERMWGQEREFQTTNEIEKKHTLLLLEALKNGDITSEQFANTIGARMGENRAAAGIDFLTDLYNRAGGSKRTKEILSLGRRTGSTTSAIMIDLDNFKASNDQLGHLAGDSALIAAADHIKTTVRESDIPIRWGGDEFLIILPNTNIEKGADVVGSNLKSQASDTITYAMEDQGYTLPAPITFSIGVAEEVPVPDDRTDIEDREIELTYLADKALKVAKFMGKNKMVSSRRIGDDIVHTDRETEESWTAEEDEIGNIKKLNPFGKYG